MIPLLLIFRPEIHVYRDKSHELREDSAVTDDVSHSLFPLLLKSVLEAKGKNERKKVILEIGNENLNNCDDKVFYVNF